MGASHTAGSGPWLLLPVPRLDPAQSVLGSGSAQSDRGRTIVQRHRHVRDTGQDAHVYDHDDRSVRYDYTLQVVFIISAPNVNVVNIGGNYECGRSVHVSVCPSVCLFVYVYFEALYLHNGAR